MAVRSFGGVVAVCLVASTIPLYAHMKAAKYEPAADSTVATAPKQVAVWFTQSPDEKLSKLEMSGPSGPVKLTGFHVMASDKSIMATIDQPLANGRYTVRWQSAGDDGHIQKSQFAFTMRQTE
jgi:methionine-rich copper-binding protein CopC